MHLSTFITILVSFAKSFSTRSTKSFFLWVSCYTLVVERCATRLATEFTAPFLKRNSCATKQAIFRVCLILLDTPLRLLTAVFAEPMLCLFVTLFARFRVVHGYALRLLSSVRIIPCSADVLQGCVPTQAARMIVNGGGWIVNIALSPVEWSA